MSAPRGSPSARHNSEPCSSSKALESKRLVRAGPGDVDAMVLQAHEPQSPSRSVRRTRTTERLLVSEGTQLVPSAAIARTE
jgi:hypothetical protein